MYFALFGTFSSIFRDKNRVGFICLQEEPDEHGQGKWDGFDKIEKPIDISNLCIMSNISNTVNCIILKYLLT
jgi:hypothetical protein